MDGRPEYVLLPMAVYKVLHESIEREVMRLESQSKDDYVAFDPAEYVENPIGLARLQSHIRQIELAELLGVSQAYISKVENQEIVSPKLLARVRNVLDRRRQAKH